MKTNRMFVAAAALSGLLAGAAAYATGPSSSTDHDSTIQAGQHAVTLDTAKHDCKGKNACKGQGGCSTGDNGCKGKNSCKGKGGCSTESTTKPGALLTRF